MKENNNTPAWKKSGKPLQNFSQASGFPAKIQQAQECSYTKHTNLVGHTQVLLSMK
jgi:hypothetical protein